MGWREVQEIHRQSNVKKRALMNKRDSLIREEEVLRKTKIKSSEDAHKAEIAKIWKWYHDEMQMEAEYVADAIVGAQR